MKRKRSWRRGLLIAAALVVALVSGGCVVSSRLATRYAENLPRDPETGVVPGAEARSLSVENPRGAVLLVHGFVGSPRDFGSLPERLAAEGWDVEAVLLPGNGTDPRELKSVTADAYLSVVRERIVALRADHDTVVLCGFSMGAAVSTCVAAEERVDALVLGAPFAGVTYKWFYILAPQVWGKITRPIVPWVYKGRLFIQVNRPEAKSELFSYDWIPGAAFETLDDLGERVNAPGVAEAVQCPVFWIHSEGDVAASYGAAEKVFARFPSAANAHVMPARSNHHVFVDYDRDEVVESVAAFLDRQFPRSN